MEKLHCCMWLFVFFSFAYSKIIINELSVPKSIPLNGTIEIIDLDCKFQTVNESGIEVKWFFNGEYEQIYQWVPGYNDSRTAMGILKDRLDPKFKVTNNSDTEYRGFRITDIVRELTGNYTCKISGETDEASKTKQMVIYSPAKSGINFILNNNEFIICSGNGLYPEPEVDFYILQGNGTKIDINEDQNIEVDEDGYYNINATHDITEYNHSSTGSITFICNISIPGTDYFLFKEIVNIGNDHDQTLTNVTIEEDLNITLTRNDTSAEIISDTHRDNSGIPQLSTSLLAIFISILVLLY
ncbi:uncharacterized protein LOC130441438 isoform X1 [Diorhabda sublineata]|uniref:uncharacterized protein LOC130441438 isoform X1 n=1 Tax=Diorhabda sublineata TaxID=1163346 RepID=UPI0024E0C3D8|nr:uncharacterized protein LOC130441438 isoform X1 [Diorhabda sublineata]